MTWTALNINLDTLMKECLVLALEPDLHIPSQDSYNCVLCLPAQHTLQEFSQQFLPQAAACDKAVVYL